VADAKHYMYSRKYYAAGNAIPKDAYYVVYSISISDNSILLYVNYT